MTAEDVLAFVLTGLATVAATLVLLAALTAAVGWVFRRRARGGTTAVVAAPALEEAGPEADGISPELVVILAAAAVASEDGPVRVVRIREAPPRAWASAGRNREHASHRLR